MSASWSRDGQWIAFDRNQRGSSAIWRMPAQGGEARPFIEDEYFNFAPAWAPDGSKMLFISMRQPMISNIWECDLASEMQRPLTNQTSAIMAYSISSRGELAYSGTWHQTDLYMGKVGEDIKAHQNLTRSTLNNFGAKFSPDGKTILYHSDRAGNYDVWMYRRETGEHVQLTEHPGTDVVPDWSPNGDFFFLSNRGGKFQLWIIDKAKNSPRLLSDAEIPFHSELPVITRNGPRWSPDGSMIGYTAAGGDSAETLWLIDMSSGNVRKTHLEGALSFDWYLDSERVIYIKRTSKGSMKKELRAANLRTGEDVLLLAGACSEPTVNPAGDGVAFFHTESIIATNVRLLHLGSPKTETGLPIAVGTPTQLIDGQGMWHTAGFAWAPDGKTFVYTRDTDFGDIFAIENYK